MGLYIPGTSIRGCGVGGPIGCGCPCYNPYNGRCQVVNIDVGDPTVLGFPDFCPIVHVQSPHGRLGDLGKLVEKIDGIWDCNDMVFKPDDHCCNVPEDCKGCKWAQTKDCIQRMVENAPTIIEAEEC